MSGHFNAKIFVDKLAKLNNSQQSIETLSHWCIFHRTNAKQVVETWDGQFHCSPRDQRTSFLYLANDILQNSRRKGSEFVVEFWKVLPNALSDVIENGDEFGRNAALRLVNIWEDRKVFGSRGQILKGEVLGRFQGKHNIIEKTGNNKLKHPVGDVLEKLVSDYQHVYNGPLDEDMLLSKCQTAINCVEKVEMEIGNYLSSGINNNSEVVRDIQGQHGILRECIEQLKAAESSRAVLVSHLKQALCEQEMILGHVRDKLQAAKSRSELAGNICEQLRNRNDAQLSPKQRPKEDTSLPVMPNCFPAATGEGEVSSSVMYSQQGHHPVFVPCPEDNLKATAAAMAAKLTASTSSAEMLTSLLSSLASESGIGQQTMEDHPSDSNKRAKLENGVPYVPPQHQQSLHPQFPHPDLLIIPSTQPPMQQLSSSMHPISTMLPLQMPLSFLPVQSPLPTGQVTQSAGSTTSTSYTFTSSPLMCPPQMPSFTSSGVPSYPNPSTAYQNVQASEGGVYLTQSISHQ